MGFLKKLINKLKRKKKRLQQKYELEEINPRYMDESQTQSEETYNQIINKLNKQISDLKSAYQVELETKENNLTQKIKEMKDSYETSLHAQSEEAEKKLKVLQEAYQAELAFRAENSKELKDLRTKILKEELANAYKTQESQKKRELELENELKKSLELQVQIQTEYKQVQAQLKNLELELEKLQAERINTQPSLSETPNPELETSEATLPIPPAPPPPQFKASSPIKGGGKLDLSKAILKHILLEGKKHPDMHEVVDIHHLKIRNTWSAFAYKESGVLSPYGIQIKKILNVPDLEKIDPEIKNEVSAIILSIQTEKKPLEEEVIRRFQENKNKLGAYPTLAKQSLAQLLINYVKEKKENDNLKSTSLIYQLTHHFTTQTNPQIALIKETDPTKKLEKLAKNDIPSRMPEIYNTIRRYFGYTSLQRVEDEAIKFNLVKKIYNDFIPKMSLYFSTNSMEENKKWLIDFYQISNTVAQGKFPEENSKIKDFIKTINKKDNKISSENEILKNDTVIQLFTTAKKESLSNIEEYTENIKRMLMAILIENFLISTNDYLKTLHQPEKEKPLQDKFTLFHQENKPNTQEIDSKKTLFKMKP